MIRAHVAAPQSGGLRSELQHEDGAAGPKTPDTPKTASGAVGAEAPPARSGSSAPPTQDPHAAANGGTHRAGTALGRTSEAIALQRPAPAEPTVTELLALARSSGGASPLAAHRLLEAVSEGSLRRVHTFSHPREAVTLDPMCCVGCGTLMQDLASLGLRRAPQQWEWTCQACLQPTIGRSEQPTHAISTPEQ
jgi:hypothetical protein